MSKDEPHQAYETITGSGMTSIVELAGAPITARFDCYRSHNTLHLGNLNLLDKATQHQTLDSSLMGKQQYSYYQPS